MSCLKFRHSIAAIACASFFLICPFTILWAQTPTNSELYRPAFHFSPEENWINDPAGLVFDGSEYHLFNQYNPHGDQWGHMSWSHAVSKDLVSWHDLPVAIEEENSIGIFTGSTVLDSANTGGFGKNGIAPLVAIPMSEKTRLKRPTSRTSRTCWILTCFSISQSWRFSWTGAARLPPESTQLLMRVPAFL